MVEVARVERQRRISAIWLLPLVALLAGAWMFYQYYTNKGEMIYIAMEHAEGIVVGKTEIKARSVKIGVIKQVRLSDDRQQVLASAEIDKQYTDLLTTDAKIWAVKPRVDETGISGLNTLLSGSYLEFLPGKSLVPNVQFTLLNEPPLIGDDVAGGRFQLFSDDADQLEVGTGLYFDGFKVGQIESSLFDWQQQKMRYQLFVEAPYHSMILDNTLFWVRSGFAVNLSADGIALQTGSLASMLKGGITFGIPDDEVPGEPAQFQRQFALYKDQNTALEQRYGSYQQYLVNFEQSIRGLKAGAPVEYRGIRIGTVLQAPATLLNNDVPINFAENNTAVPVLIKIEYGRLYKDAELGKAFWQNHVQQWVGNGMRASLKTGNLLTGALYVDMDLYQDAPDGKLTELVGLPVFPSVNSGLNLIAGQVSSVLNKINALPIEQTLSHLDHTMLQFQQLAGDMQKLVARNDVQQLPSDIQQSLQQLQHTLASFDQRSPVYQDLQNTLSNLQQVLNSLQPISKGLNEQPSMLIFDKDLPADPQPRSQHD